MDVVERLNNPNDRIVPRLWNQYRTVKQPETRGNLLSKVFLELSAPRGLSGKFPDRLRKIRTDPIHVISDCHPEAEIVLPSHLPRE